MNLTKKTLILASKCDDREKQFAELLYAGIPKSRAFKQVYGYISNPQMLNKLAGPAGDYLDALRFFAAYESIPKILADKNERLNVLAAIIAKSYTFHSETKEAAHGAVVIKAINEINRMMGTHAAKEINVKGVIMQATIDNKLTSEQCSDIYKQIMEGSRIKPDEQKEGLKLIGSDNDLSKSTLIEKDG